MGQKVYGRFFGLALFGVVSLVSTVSAEVRYTVTDLGTLGGNSSNAQSINNFGVVAGYAATSSGQSHACLWADGQIADLIPDRNKSAGLAINNLGQVAGAFEKPEDNAMSRAFFFDGTTLVDLGTLGGTESIAFDLNDLGQVVGYSRMGMNNPDPISTQAFVWQNGVMVGLGTLGGSVSYAYGINNKGEIVGEASTDSQTHAFVWKDNVMTGLGTLGGTWSEAHAINEASQIAGVSEISDGFWRAFLYRDGSMQNLGTLGGDISWAIGINNLGQIVGYSDLITGNDLSDFSDYRAYLWENGQMIDLNTLIDGNSGWNLFSAYSINDLGQIVGEGIINGQTHAFLLTPVPEPMTLAMLALGGLTVLNRYRS